MELPGKDWEVGELLAVDDVKVLSEEVWCEFRSEFDGLRDGAAAVGVEFVRFADAMEGDALFLDRFGPVPVVHSVEVDIVVVGESAGEFPDTLLGAALLPRENCIVH